jgi:methyl-accepting chemotaxis protein
MNSAVEQIKLGLNDVRQMAEATTREADRFRSNSQALRKGAADQVSSIQEISSSLQEMSSATYLNAENAEQASKTTETATGATIDSSSKMRLLSDTIVAIKSSSMKPARSSKPSTTLRNRQTCWR